MSKEIRDRYDEARSAWAEWRTRALEDLKFSNPAKPEQWDEDVIRARGKNRPALVFDQTNQYIGQVVNDARQNKPSIDVMPGDSNASDEAAEFYGGLIRQIEYASRAQIAYDTAIEYAARIGLGFILVVPELVDGKLNDHDIRIKSVVDPLAVTFDPDSIEPDGQDADCGWIDTTMSEAAFKRRWPKGKIDRTKVDSWFDGKGVKVCQYFERTYEKKNRIVTRDGREWGEDEYHAESQKSGIALPVHTNYTASTAKVTWQHLSGEEVLDETEYPAPWIGIVPVYGNVLWVDGKRQICGMTRRMMDACRAYNYSRSAEIEAIATQPKAPWLAVGASIAAYQARWEASNRENAAVLPYDHLDKDGNLLPPPKRQDPPQIGSAFGVLSQQALQDVQASVGMFKSSLGQNSNAKSGVAINKLQTEGDTATFHYIDNEARSIEQVGRLCVAMIPTYFDRERVARILKVDGKPQAVKINPSLQTAHADAEDGTLEVNPAVGAYDVRIKTGPSYTSMRQEMADKLVQMGQSNPPLAAALSPLVLQMADMPGADKAIKVAMALLPPEVRKAYDDENTPAPEIPPEVKQQMEQIQQELAAAHQHIEELGKALNNASEQMDQAEADTKQATEALAKLEVDAYGKITDRVKVLQPYMTPEIARALLLDTSGQALQHPDPLPDEMAEGIEHTMPRRAMPAAPPDPNAQAAQTQPTDPASAGSGVSGPEEGAGVITPPAMAATGANPGLGEPEQGM